MCLIQSNTTHICALFSQTQHIYVSYSNTTHVCVLFKHSTYVCLIQSNTTHICVLFSQTQHIYVSYSVKHNTYVFRVWLNKLFYHIVQLRFMQFIKIIRTCAVPTLDEKLPLFSATLLSDSWRGYLRLHCSVDRSSSQTGLSSCSL